MTTPIALPLDWLRSLSEAFLPDTCDVSRYVETNGPDGVTQDWATVRTGVPCRVSPLASSAAEALGGAEQMRASSDWTVWVPHGTDVTVRDRLLVGPRSFEVTRVGQRSYESIRECLCTEVL